MPNRMDAPGVGTHDQCPRNQPLYTPETIKRATLEALQLVEYVTTATSDGVVLGSPEATALILDALRKGMHCLEQLFCHLERHMWFQVDSPLIEDDRRGYDAAETVQEIAELMCKAREALPWLRIPVACAAESANHLNWAEPDIELATPEAPAMSGLIPAMRGPLED